MGNREDLLAGARQALLRKGVAKTTARDIAAAAGVSLAAIGYHFGSKDRLVTEALTEAMGDGVGDALAALIGVSARERTVGEAFAPVWNGVREILDDNRESLLLQMDNAARMMRSPEAQQFMAGAITQAYDGIAEGLRAAHPELSAEQASALGKLYFVLLQGLSILWLLAPDADLPSGDELALAIETLR
jgi:AcrR family transcriptional regulator